MQHVWVLTSAQKPLMPCHPARARELLREGKASVARRFPFTIQLTEREDGDVQEVELKVDPGSRTSGLALVAEGKRGRRVIFAANLSHRGLAIQEALLARKASRRSRRQRHTRYRPCRFDNRKRPEGWLPPSLQSRVDNVHTWAAKIFARVPLSAVVIETVRFDTQKLVNPEISGLAYQQGELLGYEIREYLLEKWGRCCAYCGKKDIPLELEHLIPRSRGGSDRVSNLAIACRPCNEKKANRAVHEFVKDQKRLEAIVRHAKASLKDATAINSTRYAIGEKLRSLKLPTSFWSGGRTKANRITQGYAKDHWIDAACVGETGGQVFIRPGYRPLLIQAEGRGSRQKCLMDRYGFPRTSAKTLKRVQGFQTGDMVKAHVTQGKKQGSYIGRLAVRSTGNFNIKTKSETVQGISHVYCRILHKVDGYSYIQ